QVAKYQEHSCHSDENGNNQPEAGVKGKIPPADTQTLLVGTVAIERDEEKVSSQKEMESADDNKKGKASPNARLCPQQNSPHQHLFDFFVPFRRAAEQEHGCCRCHHVGNADNCFLRNLTGAFSGERENRTAKNGEPECDAESGPAVKVESKKQGYANPERRHLRHGDIDENDAALDDMEPQVNESPRQKNAGQDGPDH